MEEKRELELKIAERKVLSNVFPEVKKMPQLNNYKWRKQIFKKDEILFTPSKPCNRFMLIGNGTIRIELQKSDTRVITLYRVEPGQLCIHSLINLINDTDYSYVATAEDDGWFCWADKQQFKDWMMELGEFQHWIFNNIGTRFKQVISRFAQQSFIPVEQRLADLLLEYMGKEQLVTLTQIEMASELGTAREIVSRHLSKWQKNGWIKTKRGEIEILQIEALYKLSE